MIDAVIYWWGVFSLVVCALFSATLIVGMMIERYLADAKVRIEFIRWYWDKQARKKNLGE